MKIQLTMIALVLTLGCSGGTKNEGDADTGTDPGADPTGEAATDPATDPVPDAIPDATADGGDDPVTDPGEDSAEDPTADPAADPTEDPSIEPYPDPRPDPDADPTPDPSIEPYPDPRPDPIIDTGGDGACVDPCAGGTVSGCGADCGGFAGTPCPSTSLTCIYPTGWTAGFCIPTASLGCSTDVDCACFPAFRYCTSTTVWACRSGRCAASCT